MQHTITHLELQQNDRHLEHDELDMLLNSKKNLYEVYKVETAKWAQRAKHKWISDGDANTSNFHKIASLKHKKHLITSMEINGEIFTDFPTIQKHGVSFYKNLFGKGGLGFY